MNDNGLEELSSHSHIESSAQVHKSIDSSSIDSEVSSSEVQLGRNELNAVKNVMRKSPSGVSLTSINEDSASLKSEKITSTMSNLLTNGFAKGQTGQHLEYQLICDPETQSIREGSIRQSVYDVERRNLVNLFKLVNKALIESCINSNRMIDYDQNQVLHHFLNVLEQILKHALKNKKGLLFGRKELWPLFEMLETFLPSSRDLINSVRELPNIKSNVGRARAFIRLAFVQKFLPDYFRFIIERKDLLGKFYEPQALMMCEEAVQVHGILIGLSIVDCNWCAKDEDLDNLSLTIELTPYLRILKNIDDGPSPDENEQADQPMLQKVLDQKNYVEELNKQLNGRLTVLNERIKELEESKESQPFNLRETLSQMLNDSIGKLGASGEPASSEELLKKLLEQDPHFLRDLFSAKDKLSHELQTKSERETALAAMEKDVYEKQETIVTIRKQMEDVKAINIQLYNKLKECEHTLKGKMEQISLLEQKNSVMEATMLQYEAKSIASESKYCALAESHKRTCEQFVELGNAKSKLDQTLEQEIRDRLKVQNDNRRLEDQIKQLQQELKDIRETNFDFEKLRREYLTLQKRCSEYELTMEELGIKLQSSKLETEQLKETSISKDAVWTPDQQATECFSCAKPFTVARRRHHCRYCGHIFCAACSDNRLPLPSSSKPCRVCDACHVILLERYSAK